MRIISRVLGLTIVVFAIAIAVGCVRQTEVVRLLEDTAVERKAYSRLLVVDVSEDRNQRQLFEDELVSRLRAQDTEAFASNKGFGQSGGVWQEKIDALSAEYGADGILITRIVSVETTADVKKGREDIVSVCRRGDPFDYFLYDHEILREPDTVELAHTVMVVSNLYDATSHERVWAIQSTCFEKPSMSEVLLEEAKVIVRQLRIDGLTIPR